MKKIIYSIACAFFCAACFLGMTSCQNSEKKGISVVCTIFPEYDWAKEVAKDNTDVEVSCIISSGVDLHSFSPSVDDVLKISKCDILVYVGGESDTWVDNALKNKLNNDMTVINLMDVLGDKKKEEEIKEGMEAEEEGEDDEEEVEYDEHVWLSLRNAEIFVNTIAKALGDKDSSNKDNYLANANSYIEKLNNLDKKYEDAVSKANKKVLLFGDRFPFRYLVDDYKIDYYAAFVGCSAETEASFATISFLVSKVDELNLSAIITIDGSSKTIAETIRDNSKAKNQSIYVLNSLQSVTKKDQEAGATYLSIMESNLNVLIEALR